ncbi:hypothetical protein GGF44_000327 [Coemansia sp. RSA 1694]|nr:hypothetical protein GGF44_000327 [Coemansia sp. RSA 1694]
MSMDVFNELQTVLRLHYSRPSTAFGQSKKKLRRVVSTGNVSIASRLANVDSLGIRSAATISQPCPDDQASERKHDLDTTALDYPAKRCRRVVSELPPTSLSSLFEYGCDGSSLDFSDASSAPFWSLDCTEHVAGTSVAADQSPVHQLATQQAGPIDMQLPLLLPTFDGPVQHSPSIYELSMAAAHGVSAETFTAATMAAIAGFEEALSSPMVHSTDCAPIAATIRDSSFGSLVPGFAPPFHDSMIRPDCADMMSAFAAAAASPTCPPQDLAGAFGHQTMDAAAAVAAAVAAEECNQALVEAFGRYYAESALEGTPDMQFPFCEWSDVIAGDRDAGVSTAITAMELASGAAPGVRHASTSDSAVATASPQTSSALAADKIGKTGRPGSSAPATKSKQHPQATRVVGPASEAAAHSASPCARPLLAKPLPPANESVNALVAARGERVAGSKPSQCAKDLRSSPSCTQSTTSTSRASDTTLAARSCSSRPAAKGEPESAPADLLCKPEPDIGLACDNSPVVIDWLNNLKNILDIDSHLFADSACQAGPLFEDGGGQTWPFVFAHHDL